MKELWRQYSQPGSEIQADSVREKCTWLKAFWQLCTLTKSQDHWYVHKWLDLD